MINNLSIVLICSLPVKGMKSIGNIGLLNIKNKTIIEWHILNLKQQFKKADIVVVGGFEHKKIEKTIRKYRDIKFLYHDVNQISNEGQSLIYALSNIPSSHSVLVYNINCIFTRNIWKDIDFSRSFTIINEHKKYSSQLGATITNNYVENIFYNLEHKMGNIYFIEKNDINLLKENIKPKYDSMYLFEILNILIKINPIVPQYIKTSEHININNMKDYYKIKGIFK
jgi:choline kinase